MMKFEDRIEKLKDKEDRKGKRYGKISRRLAWPKEYFKVDFKWPSTLNFV